MAVSPNIVIEKCRQAGVSFWTASQAAVALKGKIDEKTNDRDVNRKISSALREIDENAANQFESYHSIEVRTSKSTLETFDRERIADSLVKETRLPRAVADEIAYAVENDIRRSQLKNISAALIREMVNSALLERKLVSAQANYTRVGLPVYDIKNIIERKKVSSPFQLNEMFGNVVLKEFTLHKLLPKKISDAYLNSDIHIHALEHFGTSPYSLNNDLRVFLKEGFRIPKVITTGPAKKADVAAYHAVRLMVTSKRFIARGVSFDFFNVFMAPYIRKKTRKEIAQVCQAFLYEINNTSGFDNTFTVNMNTKVPRFLKNEDAIGPGGKRVGKYGDFEEEASAFMSVFLDTMQKGDYSKNAFNLPNVCIKHDGNISEKLVIPRPCYFIKQTDKNQSLLYNNVLTERDSLALRSGIMQAVSINMPKIAKLNKDEKSFYDAINEKLDLTRDLAIEKRELIKDRLYKNEMLSFLAQFHNGEEYIRLKDFKYLVLLSGLPQACRIYLDKNKYDEDCANLTERIIRFAQRKFREYRRNDDLQFLVGEHADIGAMTRFVTENKKLGINEDISGLQSEAMEEEERADYCKKLQPLFDGGSFYETAGKNLPKYKDFIYLKTF
ncbi:MAG: anaerobic ribonucleoside-triphosphate reductase [archaeon]